VSSAQIPAPEKVDETINHQSSERSEALDPLRPSPTLGDDSPTLEAQSSSMDVDNNRQRLEDAFSLETRSQEQNIAETLSNMADTAQHTSSSTSRTTSQNDAISSLTSQPENGTTSSPISPTTSPTPSHARKGTKAASIPSSTRVTRRESSALAAAAAATKEAEARAAAQSIDGVHSPSRNVGFEQLADAINAASQRSIETSEYLNLCS
jgi:hypothetical protein